MLKISVVFVLGLAHFSNCDFSLEEKECFAKETILDEKSGKCYALLTQGPCKEGERFVLERTTDLNPAIKGVCKKNPCDGGKIFWRETRQCVNKDNDKIRVCGNSKNSELSTNVFGEAECICNKNPPHARRDENSKSECYLLYGREPCEKGQLFAYKNENSEFPECIRDPCDKETKQRKLSGTLARGKYLVKWSDGICYELDTQGPCPEDSKLQVELGKKTPICETFVNQLEIGSNCKKDINGRCIFSDKIPLNNANKYYQDLLCTLKKRKRAAEWFFGKD